MNPKLAFIHKRRSVRAYRPDPVPEALLQDILAAGMAAPSAVNKRPYEIIVMSDPKVLNDIAAFLPNGSFLATAPLGMIVCGDIEIAHGNELPYLLQDCSALIENLLLAIANVDLGACWLGVYPRPERVAAIRDYFQLPERIIPVAALAIGYPAVPVPAPRDGVDANKIHRNKW